MLVAKNPKKEKAKKEILPTRVHRYTYQGWCMLLRVLNTFMSLKLLGNERKQHR